MKIFRKRTKKACYPLAISFFICYYIKAFRTGADFPQVAAVSRLGRGADASGGNNKKIKENNQCLSYP